MIKVERDRVISSGFFSGIKFSISYQEIHNIKTSGRKIILFTKDGSEEIRFSTHRNADRLLDAIHAYWAEITPAAEASFISNTDQDIKACLSGPKPDIVRAVDLLLEEAIKFKASDIHFKRLYNSISVQFRINGLFYELSRIPLIFFDRIITRIKILSNLTIYKANIPQDGKLVKDDTEMRVSVMPATKGEQVVIRVFNLKEDELSLELLNFQESAYNALKHVTNMKDGVVLFTGPSSSGKTTTMYSLLKEIEKKRARDTHIITLEDPVEFDLKTITQVQVDEETGINFRDGLKTVLRQDPEVIMVGEIRDSETVKTAMRAGLTGHLVISTIHAGHIKGIFPRLLDMGVEPYLLRIIRVVIAQRLVSALCPHCKIHYRPSSDEKDILGKDVEVLYRPGKCKMCHNTGYSGRLPVTEVLVVDGDFRESLKAAKDRKKMISLMDSLKIPSLMDSAIEYVQKGMTTLDEVIRVIGEN